MNNSPWRSIIWAMRRHSMMSVPMPMMRVAILVSLNAAGLLCPCQHGPRLLASFRGPGRQHVAHVVGPLLPFCATGPRFAKKCLGRVCERLFNVAVAKAAAAVKGVHLRDVRLSRHEFVQVEQDVA